MGRRGLQASKSHVGVTMEHPLDRRQRGGYLGSDTAAAAEARLGVTPRWARARVGCGLGPSVWKWEGRNPIHCPISIEAPVSRGGIQRDVRPRVQPTAPWALGAAPATSEPAARAARRLEPCAHPPGLRAGAGARRLWLHHAIGYRPGQGGRQAQRRQGETDSSSWWRESRSMHAPPRQKRTEAAW